jgi:hypothetical protein
MGAEMGFAVDEAPFQKAVFAQKTIDANFLLVPSLVLEHEAGERQQGQTKATGPEVAEVAR